MRAIGLDMGERRIGIAVSDARGIAAQPTQVMERESLAEDVRRIGEMVRSRGVKRIIVGLPINMDGSSGPAARRARRFANRLGRELGIEVVMQDERLSTTEAERALVAADRSRAQRRELRDAVAAALILQSYLDAQQRGEGE